MAFPLGSLGTEPGSTPPASGRAPAASSYTRTPRAPKPPETASEPPRWRTQLVVLLGAVGLVLLLLALLTYAGADAAWSTSGNGSGVHNKAGVLGAWVSNLMFFLFGYSAWWLVLVAVRAWLGALALWLRSEQAPAPQQHAHWPRWLLWAGLIVLMCASSSLEWTRLYQFEGRLPGHAGGALGYSLGPPSVKLLGFTGSGVWWIAVLLA